MFIRFLIYLLLFYLIYRLVRNIFGNVLGQKNQPERNHFETPSDTQPGHDTIDKTDIEDAIFEEIDEDAK